MVDKDLCALFGPKWPSTTNPKWPWQKMPKMLPKKCFPLLPGRIEPLAWERHTQWNHWKFCSVTSVKDERMLERMKTKFPWIIWSLFSLVNAMPRKEMALVGKPKLQTWELEIMLFYPKNNIDTNGYEITANTVKLDNNIRFSATMNLESFNSTGRVKKLSSLKVSAWLNSGRDYMNVIFESMGFSDKEYTHVFISASIWLKQQGFGSGRGAAGPPLQSGRPHTRAQGCFLKETAACRKDQVGSADHGEDPQWSRGKVWEGRRDKKDPFWTDRNHRDADAATAFYPQREFRRYT